MLEHTTTKPGRGKPRRTTVVVLAGLAVVIAGGVAIALLPVGATTETTSTPEVSTAPVTSGDMVSETKVAGAIAYSRTEPVTSGLGGVVTELPASGATVGPGDALYRVNTVPVILLEGSAPAWRDFASGMTDGNDVLQLEQNLAAFGFLGEEPNARFDWDTTVAIREWQEAIGLERTGTVERATVLFWSGRLRVDQITARVGQEVGPGSALYNATTEEKVVDVAVKSSDRALAVVGETVTVTLIDGSTIDGVVQQVGAPVSRPESDGASPSIVVPVRVSIADQSAVADLALATVTVSFASALRDDVLTVPVDALVPIDETNYAVELPQADPEGERELVPVTIGAVASGRVEISGDGIAAGVLVVVPTR